MSIKEKKNRQEKGKNIGTEKMVDLRRIQENLWRGKMFGPWERRRTEMRKMESISAVETKNGEGVLQLLTEPPRLVIVSITEMLYAERVT